MVRHFSWERGVWQIGQWCSRSEPNVLAEEHEAVWLSTYSRRRLLPTYRGLEAYLLMSDADIEDGAVVLTLPCLGGAGAGF